MNFEKGFIIIVNKQWANFNRNNSSDFVVVWIRKNSFKAVPPNSPIFFLEKGTRLIRGFGYLSKFELNSIRQTWDLYTHFTGSPSYELFLKMLNLENNQQAAESKIGCILIKDIIWSQHLIPISDVKVEFHSATVTGKTISKDESNHIIELISQEL